MKAGKQLVIVTYHRKITSNFITSKEGCIDEVISGRIT